MKKALSIFGAILLLVSLSACGNSKPGKTSDISTVETTSNGEKKQPAESEQPTYELLEATKPFQGEWENTEFDGKVIISGNTVNYVYYGAKRENAVSDVYTFYFAFDDKGNLVVENDYHQARQILYIDENGILVKKDSYTGEEEKNGRYKKISDNTVVPEVAKDPYIGMTEEQVLSSSWGNPQKTNKTTTVNGASEQWVYDYGYIYITNGYVTAIQEK